MRIGIMVGEVGGPVGLDDLLEQARAAQSVWAAQAFGWDALTALVVAGARDSALRLGTSVVPVRQRHPLVLAGQALSVQAATGNRLTLGIGAGIGAMVSGMFGLSSARPASHMREYLSVLLPLLRGEQVEHRGEMITAVGAVGIPGAVAPPVLLAALGTRMLQLAGASAQGTITWMTGPRTLSSHVVPVISAAAREAGRAAPQIVAGLPVTVTDDVDDVRERIAERFGMAARVPEYRAVLDREGVAGAADVAIVGDEAAVEHRVKQLFEAGVTEFVASPFGTTPERARTAAFLHSLT